MKKAFTLVEMIVVAAILFIIIAIVGSCASQFVNRGPQAEDKMREYLQKLYPSRQVIGVACTNVDTDGDGYVSCTGTVDIDGKEKQVNAQCSSQVIGFNSGCKPMFGFPSQ